VEDVFMGDSIALVLSGRHVDLGFTVRRALPAPDRRLVGPFIFWDHFGPAHLEPGKGIDVRPHPHICLATITYMFEGSLRHKDSLGNDQLIKPGEVNWMVAGRGIVHSERTPPDDRARGPRFHGIQTWIALPKEREEEEPIFQHHTAGTMPLVRRDGALLRVIAGESYGVRSPVAVYSPTLYVEARLDPGGTLTLPTEFPERAAYVVGGEVEIDERSFEPGSMIVYREGAVARLRALTAARVMLLGGATIEGERHIWWNFVASSTERMERAKRDWKEGRFPKVPGEAEFIPLPDP
jgi:redox-sensitive bicupin YhaK (pirin superfamily)